MEIWVIAIAVATTCLVLVVASVSAFAAAWFLWQRFAQAVMRGLGAVYLPRPPVWPSSRPPPKKREPIPEPMTTLPVVSTQPARARPTLVPSHEEPEDLARTTAFPRYNTEDEVDTESDEGGVRGVWDEDLGDGRSNISLEGDITPRPGEPRIAEPFRPPRGRRSLIHLFRKDKE